jgi:diketogulonate reductase-like aldo/keto reductase
MWGVSNFDVDEMAELWDVGQGGNCAANQVLYNLQRRGIEHDLLPWMETKRLPTMAYSPLEQGRSFHKPALDAVAQRHDATAYQIALAWTLRRPDVISIPKAVKIDHVEQNRAALDITLSAEDLAELDAAFPPPTGKEPLAIL